MSDPYNSYGSSIPPLAPPSPRIPPKPTNDPIARLDVSETWKRRFRLIDKAGGPDLPRFRDLPFGERFRLNSNLLAFIFGPFYYVAKGLWRQAALFLIMAIALALLFEVIGLGKLSRGIGYGFAALYMIRANTSYYRKVVLGDAPWL